MAALKWKDFENAIRESVYHAVTELIDDWPDETFYAVAFHEFYAEEFDVIHLPCLAANTVEELAGSEDSRWSSPDWYWIDVPYTNKAIDALHDAMQQEATRKDVAHWYKLHDRFMQAFVNVARSLTPELKKGRPVAKDFGVFVFDEGSDNEIEVLRKCTTPATFKRLFPRLQEILDRERAVGKSSLEEKLSTYRKDLSQYRQQVLDIGEPAIPMLLDALKDREESWRAADILGELGIPDKRVVAALRRRAREGDQRKFHETIALALLGDTDFLLKLADNAKTRDVAIGGLKMLYSSAASHCLREIPLDYRPIEKLLAKKACIRKVKELSGSRREISVGDIDEALRGLESPHKVIRENAVWVLGDRRLGKKAGERVLPRIVERFQDKSADVRRLAIISIAYWKKAARPYRTAIRRLFKDPDPDVRSTARQYAKELT